MPGLRCFREFRLTETENGPIWHLNDIRFWGDEKDTRRSFSENMMIDAILGRGEKNQKKTTQFLNGDYTKPTNP